MRLHPLPAARPVGALLAPLVVALLQGAALSQAPAGYYAGVDASSPAALRATLHATIDDHQLLPYTASSTDTWDVLKLADQDPLDPARVLDVYRNASYPKVSGGQGAYNREHTWPNSYGFPNDDGKNYPYTDCHQLFLCDIAYNSARGSLPFGDGNGGWTELVTDAYAGAGGGSGSYPGHSDWYTGSGNQGSFEVWDGRRGDVARALLYLDVRYEGGVHGATGWSEPDLVLTDSLALIGGSATGQNESVAYMGRLSTLLAWHAADPPDAGGRARRDAVFAQQHNRNPFIDHPEWVDCLFAGACGGGTGGTGAAWINELHYDNAGADVGELVEVAGPAGLDLAGWSLVLYNGSGGAAYQTVPLAGVLPDQGGCLGTASFAVPGLQNGAPDGLALVDGAGAVVELLSYEGTFVCADGPAAGLSTTDLGVAEDGTTALGSSLQRSGTGAGAADFIVWLPAQAATPGAPNTGQTFAGCPPSCGATTYGLGSSPANTIALDATGSPQVGGLFSIVATNVTGIGAFHAASTGLATFPFLGGTGLVDPSQLVPPVTFRAPVAGASTWDLGVPADPAFAGVQVFFQAFSIDFGQPGGYALSNGVQVEVCP